VDVQQKGEYRRRAGPTRSPTTHGVFKRSLISMQAEHVLWHTNDGLVRWERHRGCVLGRRDVAGGLRHDARRMYCVADNTSGMSGRPYDRPDQEDRRRVSQAGTLDAVTQAGMGRCAEGGHGYVVEGRM
jgi:hypothetical protein